MKSKLMKCGILILAVLAAAAACMFYRKNRMSFQIPAAENPVTNPLKGFAAWGENYREDPWVSFAYIPVYWNLLEPEEGVYDFQELEERCHFQEWKESGVRLILRVLADSPSDRRHMDIPAWLYEKMEGAGTWYDCSYGKGFSPDYENPFFQAAHEKLIRAICDRYGQDPQLAMIQLGSLGHWGEWHVHTEAGIDCFPHQYVTDGYVQDYLSCFPANMLLLRRPYRIGADYGMGLYNDSFGIPSSHRLWLSWIENGYVSDQNQEALAGMPDFWKSAPSGGELSSSRDLSWYFSPEQFPETFELLKQSHTTFLGPNAPKYEDFAGTDEEVLIRKLLASMGCSLGIRSGSLEGLLSGKDLKLTAVWENTGVAPMIQDWPVRLEIRSKDGETVWEQEFFAPLTDWTPGSHTWTVTLSGTGALPGGSYQLLIGITDPMTGEAGLTLTMPGNEKMYSLCSFRIGF